MLLLFQLEPESYQASQFLQILFRYVIVETAALPDQVRDIGRIFLVVLVPTAVQKNPIVLHSHIGDINNLLILFYQILGQWLMIAGSGLKAINRFNQPMLILQVFGKAT